MYVKSSTFPFAELKALVKLKDVISYVSFLEGYKTRPTKLDLQNLGLHQNMRIARSVLYKYYVMHQTKNRMNYVFPSPIREINNLFVSHISYGLFEAFKK
jgi:hypothetical protein